VMLYAIEGGGHEWPVSPPDVTRDRSRSNDGPSVPSTGLPSETSSKPGKAPTELIWEFFTGLLSIPE
jgi:poly(3-hydroxybutyrate) depolymerase